MGINVGAMLPPPLFLGLVIAKFGWNWGFAAASIAMLVSLAVFYGGRKQIEAFGNLPLKSICHKLKKGRVFWSLFVLGVMITIAIMWMLLHNPEEINIFFIVASLICVGVIFYFLHKETRIKQYKMLAAIALTLISGGFWAFYTQSATSMVLFAKRNMVQEFFGIEFNPEAILYTVSSGWVVSSYFFQAFGELFLSPVGLAMVTILSTHKHVGFMMGFWFLIQAASSIVGIYLASFAAVLPNYTREMSLNTYNSAFLTYFWLSFALAIVAFLCIPFIKKLMAPAKSPL